MPKVSKPLVRDLGQVTRNFLAPEHVALEIVERRAMKIGMRIGVIPELDAGLDPLPQDSDSRGLQRRACEQLAFVDESDRGHTVMPHGCQ